MSTPSALQPPEETKLLRDVVNAKARLHQARYRYDLLQQTANHVNFAVQTICQLGSDYSDIALLLGLINTDVNNYLLDAQTVLKGAETLHQIASDDLEVWTSTTPID
jgi:hypothetical protein